MGAGFDGGGGVRGLVRVDADQHHGDIPFVSGYGIRG